MERPLERRTAARTAVVWDAIRARLETGGPGHRAARVLDIGGGTGGFAVRLASLGHEVTVVDPSPDALAALARRADEEGVAERVTGVQGDLSDLGDLVDRDAPDGMDLVLCHGVLGLVEDPAAALATMGSVLRPAGALSLVVGQLHAAVVARAMAGHLVAAKAMLDETTAPQRPDPRPAEHRFTVVEVTDLLEQAGYTLHGVHGVRVFSDLVPSTLLDLEPGAATALLDLERAVSDRSEYLTLAAQLHVLATQEE